MHTNGQLNTLKMCQDILSRHLDRTTLNEAQEMLVDGIMSNFNILVNALDRRIDEMGRVFDNPVEERKE